ncbi:MAG: phosphatase PAP2 family protein [Proteobacteria bacterium]|nr:phosphatase PAP2 family protein [Pseudomonadota bacterium]MBU1581485.1 phosphatase PAP2 family protein [Pseudomonadota bacterium]MBU2455167.1 phosphatase PAP2 family protein [Pseudomonadota bacterium]MBU2627245.1 phosphatase PAP2 family protein [Pseudomonadota bacterium]
MQYFLHNIEWISALRTDGLTLIFKAFTFMGYRSFILLFIPLGFWLFNKKIFARAGLLVMFSLLLNAFLKEIFQDPRPDMQYWLDFKMDTPYGFPSGHAQVAIVLWMWIAWEIRKKWAWIVFSIIALGICMSRLYLGVHDVEDILGGMFFGTLTLVSFGMLTTKRFKLRFDLNPLCQVLCLIFFVTGMFLIWPGKDLLVVSRYGGFLTGFWLGAGMEREIIHYEKHLKIWKQIFAGFIGIAGCLFLKKVMYVVFTAIAPNHPFLVLIQALVIGLYITLIAPWVFMKMNLNFRSDDLKSKDSTAFVVYGK